jgi:hypothetical protein
MKLRDAFFRELPGERQLFDQGARVDGQFVYVGHAPINAVVTDDVWIITFFKYDGNSVVTEMYCLKGAWSSRVSLFLEYA